MSIPISQIGPWVGFAPFAAAVGWALHFTMVYPGKPRWKGWLTCTVPIYLALMACYATDKGWIVWT